MDATTTQAEADDGIDPAAAAVKQRRVAQAICLAVSAAAVTTAIALKPDPRGLGTHEQLGLPPCSFHALTGLPCPGCGMTTAFANTVRLRFAAAFMANPFGLLLCLGIEALAVLSGVSLAFDWRGWSYLAVLERAFVLVPLFTLLVLSWAFKLAVTLLARGS